MTAKPPDRLEITHWAAPFLTAGLEISFGSEARILRKWKIQPHQAEAFKFSIDPGLETRVRDVIGLHLAPPANAAVAKANEKSPVWVLGRTASLL